MADLKTLTLKKSEWLCPQHPDWSGDSGMCVRIFDEAADIDEHGDRYFSLENVTLSPMCCLGVLAHQLGTMKSELHHLSYPHELKADLPDDYPSSLIDSEEDIAQINDDEKITREVRLAYLAPLFEEAGYKLVYKDDS